MESDLHPSPASLFLAAAYIPTRRVAVHVHSQIPLPADSTREVAGPACLGRGDASATAVAGSLRALRQLAELTIYLSDNAVGPGLGRWKRPWAFLQSALESS